MGLGGSFSLARRALPWSAPPSPQAAPRPGGPRRVGVSRPLRPVRRVVVTLDGAGQRRVVADGPSPHLHTLPGLPPDLGLTDLWDTDGAPTDRRAVDPATRALRVAPDAGGTRFRVVQCPPDSELPTDEAGAPAHCWHETPTVDYGVVSTGSGGCSPSPTRSAWPPRRDRGAPGPSRVEQPPDRPGDPRHGRGRRRVELIRRSRGTASGSRWSA
jgi:hypothetical protein